MYVRRDGTKGPLQRPYSGPYAVLTPGDKTFLIDIGGRSERISVDRIKPAFFDPFQPVILAKPPPRGRPPAKQSYPSRIPHAVIHQSQTPPLSVSKLCRALLFRRLRVQVALFDHLCDTSDSYGVSLCGGRCGVWTIKSWTLIKTNPCQMYTSEVVKRAHHRGVEETKSLLSQFRLISRHRRMVLI